MSEVNAAFYDFGALPQRSESKRRRQEEKSEGTSLFTSSTSAEGDILSAGASATTDNVGTRKQQKRAGAITESMSCVTVCDSVDEIEKMDKTPCVWDSERLQPSSTLLSPSLPTASYDLLSLHDKWEYLDHTADVLVHSWGDSTAEAFGQSALALWSHIVDRPHIQYNVGLCPPRIISAFGKDLLDLLFNFLDACLYAYGADYFLCERLRVTYFGDSALISSDKAGDGGNDSMSVGGLLCIRAQCFGELFNDRKHSAHQGTEVKAITYSAMRIFLEDGRVLNAGEGGGDQGVQYLDDRNNETTSNSLSLNKNDQKRPKGDRKGLVDIYVVLDI